MSGVAIQGRSGTNQYLKEFKILFKKDSGLFMSYPNNINAQVRNNNKTLVNGLNPAGVSYLS